MPKTDVYSMGEKGVNTTKSPIHLEDGELTRAQNWQPDPAGVEGAIRSRDGLTELNSSAMAGTVTGGIGVPLPDRSALTRTFYAAMEGSVTDIFRKSTDGTTWSTVTAGTQTRPQSVDRLSTFGTTLEQTSALRWAALNNKMYFPGNDYTDGSATSWPTLRSWDGTTEYLITEPPHHPEFAPATEESGILAIIPYSDTQLVLSDWDGTGAVGRARVYLVDVTTGQLTQLGAETNIAGAPMSLVVYQGKIWSVFAVSNGSQGSVRSVRPGDATWTTEFTPATGRAAVSLAVFQGNLYCGQAAAYAGAGNSAIISKRTASTAAWTTVLTADGTGTANILGPLIVNEDDDLIMAFWYSVSGGASPENRIVSSSDGASWATEYDVKANAGSTFVFSGHPYLDPETGDIYWPVKETAHVTSLLKRTAAGTWSIVDTTFKYRGPIVSIKF